MHYLHKILIETDGETDKDYLRQNAIEEIERYRDRVFDWAEYETAGRWADEYPDNVILGCEDVEGLIKAIEDCKQSQDNDLAYYKSQLTTDSISEFIEKNNGTNADGMQQYYFLRIAELVYGVYTCDSYFYDAINMESTINEKLYQRIREDKDNLALVIIDIHI